jgi:hypothetical protein
MLKILGACLIALAGVASAQTVAKCALTPYSVELRNANGKLTVQVPAKLSNLDPAVSLGADFNRGMYAAIAPSVVDEILESYDCAIKKSLAEDPRFSEDSRQLLRNAWSDVRAAFVESVTNYFSAWQESFAAGRAASPRNDKKDLTANEQALKPYIAKLPVDNFLKYGGFSLYGEATVYGVAVQGCGAFTRAALVDNESNVQHLANAIRPALVAYVDSVQNGSRDAKMKLWAQAATMQAAVASSKATQQAQKDCLAAKTTESAPTPVSSAASAALAQ